MGTAKSVRRVRFEREAFPHVEALWRTAMWLTMRGNSAENLIVKTMSQAYRTWDDSTDTVGSAARLFRVLTREFFRMGKRRHRSGRFLDENEKMASDSGSGGRQPASATIDDGELLLLTGIPDIWIRGTVARLQPRSRLIILLLLREGFSYPDIAYITDLPKDSIGSILGRLRRLIPRVLVQQFDRVIDVSSSAQPDSLTIGVVDSSEGAPLSYGPEWREADDLQKGQE
jgi:RNA polymerase sigma-70 factor (ECF subfamily)